MDDLDIVILAASSANTFNNSCHLLKDKGLINASLSYGPRGIKQRPGNLIAQPAADKI